MSFLIGWLLSQLQAGHWFSGRLQTPTVLDCDGEGFGPATAQLELHPQDSWLDPGEEQGSPGVGGMWNSGPGFPSLLLRVAVSLDGAAVGPQVPTWPVISGSRNPKASDSTRLPGLLHALRHQGLMTGEVETGRLPRSNPTIVSCTVTISGRNCKCINMVRIVEKTRK